MLKFLIGPALLAMGYAAGNYYGADAEQIVHEKPAIVYSAVEQAIGNFPESGTTSLEGGAPIPYEIKVGHTLDQHLSVTVYFAGRQGAQADLTFTGQNGGKDTLITTKIHADRSVLRTALAGTSKAKLAYAPDWMLNLTFRPVLQKLAQQIEQGATAQVESATQPPTENESNLTAEQRQQIAEWQQYEASRPAIDPSTAGGDYTSE